MGHTGETLLPYKEYCHDLNHSEMVHISRAKMVCKMHTPVYLFDGCSNEFKHHHKTGKLHFLLMSLKCISLQKTFFHFYYCNYCGGCLNGMTEENIQAHLNDCSQHSSKFICHECGMVSENCLWHMYFFLFSVRNLFYLFKTKFLKNYSHCFFRSMKHLT